MVLVDTNVLVYAVNSDSPCHQKCRSWLEAQRTRPDAWYSTWQTLYEFLRVTTHPKVLQKPWSIGNAWSFISALLASPGLEILVPTSRHAEVARTVFEELPFVGGNLVHDAHIAVLMREHGIRRICTRDADFHRFPFIEVIDPLQL